MRVFRDSTFEFSYVAWQLRPPRPSLTIVVKATYDIVPDGVCAIAAKQVPCAGEQHYDDEPANSVRVDTDLAVLKPRGECHLAGTCYPPGQRAVPVSAVGFQVGSVRKQLGIFGERFWQSTLRGGGATDPVPFTAMPLRYENSFGGPGFDANPVGRGIAPVPTAQGLRVPLPTIEDPRQPVGAIADRPRPAGAFPIPRMWAERVARAGTYDRRWVRTRWPYFPDDFDPAYFNTAPHDQQIAGYWRGDEPITLQNLHPERSLVRTTLPGHRARAFLELVGPAPSFHEVPLRLDTIAVDSDAMHVTCLWRGVSEAIASDKLENVSALYYLHEPLETARTEAEYLSMFVRRRRIDDELEAEGPAFEPTLVNPLPEAEAEPTEGVPLESPEVAALMAAVDAALAPSGLTMAMLSTAVPPDAPEPKPSEVRAAMLASGQPVPDEIAALPDPEEPAPPIPEPAHTRESVIARAAAGEPFVELDLTAIDLSGVDLSGADLSGAIFTDALFHGCRLEGTRFDGAVLRGAALSMCFAPRASFVKADLTGARCDATNFREAVFDDAVVIDAALQRCNFTSASGKKAEFTGSDCTGAVFALADLSWAEFSRTTLADCRFDDANLDNLSLEGAHAERAVFDRANMTAARPSEGARFDGASLRHVIAPKSIWSASHLNQTDFSFANLTGADFRGAFLVQSNLSAVKARSAVFAEASLVGAIAHRADAFEATFESADLSHADMRGANLFGAQFWKTKIEHAQFDLANVERTHLTSEER